MKLTALLKWGTIILLALMLVGGSATPRGAAAQAGAPDVVASPGSLPVLPVTAGPAADTAPAMVQMTDGKLLTVFARNGQLWSRISTDSGATWGAEAQIDGCCRQNHSLARAEDGTLWLAYDLERVIEIPNPAGGIDVVVKREIWHRTSTDGVSWSAEHQLATDSNRDYNPFMFQAADHKLWTVWESDRTGNRSLWYKTSADAGTTWSAEAQLAAEGYAPAAATTSGGRVVVVYNRGNRELWQRGSSNGGVTWSAETRIAGCCRMNPSLAAVGGVLWLAYENDGDIWYRTSANQGTTWAGELGFTRFVGPDDGVALVGLVSGEPAFAWSSTRSGNLDIWFGNVDGNPPPYVEWIEHRPGCNPDSAATITFRTRALDETGVASVAVVWMLNGVAQADLPMFDDGAHGDDEAGDGVWGAQHAALPAGSQVTYAARATDTDGNTYLYPGQNSFAVLAPFIKTADILLVLDTGGYNPSDLRTYYTDALDVQGYKYDTWDTGLRCAPDSTLLSQYATGVVIWAAPNGGYLTGDSNVRTVVQGYLTAGGKLFITGQNIARYLSWYGGAGFLNDYLHATYRQDDTGLFAVAGATGDPISDGLALYISGGDGANNQYSKDGVDPVGDAQAIFTYRAGAMLAEPIRSAEVASGGLQGARQSVPNAQLRPAAAPVVATPTAAAAIPTVAPEPTAAPAPTAAPPACVGSCTAGVRVDTGVYKVVYFAFGFEAINSASSRAAVMARVLTWLEGRSPRPVPLTPANGQMVPAGAVNFTWLGVPGATSYEIQIDTVSTFDSPTLIDQIVTEARFNFSFTALGAHYWCVRVLPGGDWTAPWGFSIAADVVRVTTAVADDTAPALVQTADGKLLTVFVRNGALWSRASTDGGATWAAEMRIADCCRYNPSLARAADGTLWLAYDRDGEIEYRTSADGGASWSAETQLPTDAGDDYDPAILQAADGKIWVVWRSYHSGDSNIWYKTSVDGGLTWAAGAQLTTDFAWDYEPAITQAASGRLIVVWQRYGELWQRSSSDGGVTWSTGARIGDYNPNHHHPGLAAVDGKLWLVYEKEGDIWYRTSADHGETWSDETRFTRFVGGDAAPAVAALTSGSVSIAWQADRSSNPDIWFGSPGERGDLNPPPYIAWSAHQPQPNPDSDDPITFRARALDETGVGSVQVMVQVERAAQPDMIMELPMFDDGAHGDDAAGDGVWGVQHTPLAEGSRVTYRASATDTNGNSYRYPGLNSFKVLPPFVKTAALLFVPDGGGNNSPNDTAWFRSYYTQALDALGYRYDTWDTALRGEPGSEILKQYTGGAVIWAVPYWGYATADKSGNVDVLQAYLDAGGRLFITGQNIAESLYWSSGSSFLRDYLHATFRQSDTGLFALAGAAGDPIGGGLALNISGGDGANDQYSKDEIDPITPAEVVFTYRTGVSAMLMAPHRPAAAATATPEASGAAAPAANVGSGTAGLRVDAGTYKVVYFAFGFEAINRAADRQAVIGRVLNWLGVKPLTSFYVPLILAQLSTADTFWADRDQLAYGECTTLHWSVSLTDTLAVFLEDEGVAGQGVREVCPAATTSYVLRVERVGRTQVYPLTIVVGEHLATPTRRPTPTSAPEPTKAPEPTAAP